MADKPTIIARVNTALPDNNNEEITASVMRDLLNANIGDQATQEELDTKPGIDSGITENTVVRVGASNQLEASSLEEDATTVTSNKDVSIPQGGKILFQNLEVAEVGGSVFVYNNLLDRWLFIGSRILDTSGSGRFIVEGADARQDIPQIDRFDETLTATEIGVNFTAIAGLFLDGVTLRAPVADAVNNGKFYVVIHNGTDATAPILWRSHRQFQIDAGEGFDLTGVQPDGTVFTDSTQNPLPFLMGVDVFIRFISVDANPFRIMGTTITQADIDNPLLGFEQISLGQQTPWALLRGWVLRQDALTTDAEARGQGVDAILNGTHTGVTVSATGEGINRVVNLVVDGSATAPEITQFNINGQSKNVPTGTTLTGSKVFNYTVMNPGNVDGNLTLQQAGVNLATDIDPTGSSTTQTINTVTLSNKGDSVTWRLQGNIVGGGVVSREFVVTARGRDEHLYHGLDSATTSASVLITNIDSTVVEDVAGQTVEFSVGPTSAGDYIHILAPTDHDITSLINVELGHNVLPQFTKTNNVQTLDEQTFNGYILGPVNAGFTQTYRATLA